MNPGSFAYFACVLVGEKTVKQLSEYLCVNNLIFVGKQVL